MAVRAQIIHMSDVYRCPKISLSASHYREDGSCRCDEEAERKARRDEIKKARDRFRG